MTLFPLPQPPPVSFEFHTLGNTNSLEPIQYIRRTHDNALLACSSKHMTLFDMSMGMKRQWMEHPDYQPRLAKSAKESKKSSSSDTTPTKGSCTGQVFGFRNFCYHANTSTVAVLFGSASVPKILATTDHPVTTTTSPSSVKTNKSRLIHIYDVNSGKRLKQLQLTGIRSQNMKVVGQRYQTVNLRLNRPDRESQMPVRELILVCRASDIAMYNNSSIVCVRMTILGDGDAHGQDKENSSQQETGNMMEDELITLKDASDIVAYEVSEEFIVGLQKFRGRTSAKESKCFDVCVWNIRTGDKLSTLEESITWKHSGNISEHMFVIRHNNVAYMLENGDIRLFNLNVLRQVQAHETVGSPEPKMHRRSQGVPVLPRAHSLHNHRTFGQQQSQQLQRQQQQSQIPTASLQTNRHNFTAVRLYEWISNDRLVTLSCDSVQVWEFSTRKGRAYQVRSINNFFATGELSGAWVSGDLLLVAADACFVMWDLNSGRLIGNLNVGGKSIMNKIVTGYNCITFDRRTIICADGARIGVWTNVYHAPSSPKALAITSGILTPFSYAEMLPILKTGDILQFTAQNYTYYGMVFKLRGTIPSGNTKIWFHVDLEDALCKSSFGAFMCSIAPVCPLSLQSAHCSTQYGNCSVRQRPDALLRSLVPVLSQFLAHNKHHDNCAVVVHRLKKQLTPVQFTELERFIAMRQKQMLDSSHLASRRRLNTLLYLPQMLYKDFVPEGKELLMHMFQGNDLIAESLFHVFNGGNRMRFHDLFKTQSVILTAK